MSNTTKLFIAFSTITGLIMSNPVNVHSVEVAKAEEIKVYRLPVVTVETNFEEIEVIYVPPTVISVGHRTKISHSQ